MWGKLPGLNIIGDALKDLESQLDAAVGGADNDATEEKEESIDQGAQSAVVDTSPTPETSGAFDSPSSPQSPRVKNASQSVMVSPPPAEPTTPMSAASRSRGSWSNLVQKLPKSSSDENIFAQTSPPLASSTPNSIPSPSPDPATASVPASPPPSSAAVETSLTGLARATPVESPPSKALIGKIDALEKSNKALKAKYRALQKEHENELCTIKQTHEQCVQEASSCHAEEVQTRQRKFEEQRVKQKELAEAKVAELGAIAARQSEKASQKTSLLAVEQTRNLALEARVQELTDQLTMISDQRSQKESAAAGEVGRAEDELLREIQELKQSNGQLQSLCSNFVAKHDLEQARLRQEAEERAGELSARVATLEQELSVASMDLATTGSQLNALESERSEMVRGEQTLRQTLAEREKALEKLGGMLAESTQAQEVGATQTEELGAALKAVELELEEARAQLAGSAEENRQLTESVASMKTSLSASSSSASGQAKAQQAELESLKAQVSALGQMNQDYESKLLAYTTEGQQLSKKQSEMEKAVRKSRTDLKEKEMEITKLKQSRDQLSKVVEETQELLRKHETESNSSNKSIVTLQTVNTNLQDKIYKLEGDISSKTEELATQKRALEASWNEVTECKRAMNDLRVEKEDLVARLGQGTSQVLANEGIKRDAEQREAILRATNEQLQDQLARCAEEASVRDERNRNEIVELRQRWQDAVRAREALSSELISSTTPLLRQITQSQEALRAKTVQFQDLEISYAEKNLALESQVQELQKANAALALELEDVGSKQGTLVSRNQGLTQAVTALEQQCEALRGSEARLTEQVGVKEDMYRAEAQKNSDVAAEIKEVQFKRVQDVHELAVVNEKLKLKELICEELTTEVVRLQDQLRTQKESGSGSGAVGRQAPPGGEKEETDVYAKLKSEKRAEEELIMHSDSTEAQRVLPDSLPSELWTIYCYAMLYITFVGTLLLLVFL